MLTHNDLKAWLHKPQLTRRDQLLLVLAVAPLHAWRVSEIIGEAKSAGLHRCARWNVSSILARANGLAIRVNDGWELTDIGKGHLIALGVPAVSHGATNVAIDLRAHAASLKNLDVAAFVEEAVICFEHNHFRAAVVLSWVGAVALLEHAVLKNHLAAFNAEGRRRDAKWKDVKTFDDFGRVKEYDFLQIVSAVSIIGSNVKQQLEERLKLRNACGHPNTLKLAGNTVAAHIEILILNIFEKF